MIRIAILCTFICTSIATAYGQSPNVTCAEAFIIEDPRVYCSGATEFSNVDAGESEVPALDCFTGVEHDLWFSFTALAQAVNVLVVADAQGLLDAPRVVLYEGDCTDPSFALVECNAAGTGTDVVNLFHTGLVVGETYLIRVGGAGSSQGAFQICVNNYNPPVDPGQDNDEAAILCDKSGFVIQTLSGGGDDADEATGTCLDVGVGPSEDQSSWTKWTAANDGTLTFTITPLNIKDDIDFVLYELPDGYDNFATRITLRCMANGCDGAGATGLNNTSTDVEEPAGCEPTSDNFLKAVDMEEGKSYALLINNFSSTGAGVNLDFGGTGEFQGPDPKFSIIVDEVVNPASGLVCDKLFQVQNDSESGSGSVFDYAWNFGEDAVPQTSTGEGPFNVQYLTTGKKFIALTLSSDLGCDITEITELVVEPCCSDPDGLTVALESITNVGCEKDVKGAFTISGAGGYPSYKYRFEDGEYGNVATFDDLDIGSYEVTVLDRKGCETTRTISIAEVMPINVDAGPDASVEFLGDEIQLDGSFVSTNMVDVFWSPSDNLTCSDGTSNCLNPVVIPLGTTTYTLTIVDPEGCTLSDEVTIEVLKIRPLFAPTAFSPNGDGVNDIFSLAGNAFSVSSILELNIYDLWGNPVYQGKGLSPADNNEGWDGRLNGDLVNPGVYIWYAELEFLDAEKPNEVVSGDVTLIR